jgi:Recombination endonuclease VII
MSSRRPSAKKRHARDSESRKKNKRKKSEKEIERTRAWRAIHQPEVNARRRHLWATDPDYRARKLAESRRSIERRRRKARRDPTYRARLRDAKRTNARRSFLKVKYGISLEDYDAMLARQGGVCAACKNKKRRSERLCVDHCHVTGKVRGLLCRNCNVGLGLFRDDADLVEAAAAYLRGASPRIPRRSRSRRRVATRRTPPPRGSASRSRRAISAAGR